MNELAMRAEDNRKNLAPVQQSSYDFIRPKKEVSHGWRDDQFTPQSPTPLRRLTKRLSAAQKAFNAPLPEQDGNLMDEVFWESQIDESRIDDD